MVTFIFVHGTFVKSADWPVLHHSLAQVAKDARIKQVRWTGKNRAAARQAAALDISKLVLCIRFKNPKEKIFVIGHSHGGNAIAYYLKNYPDAATVDGCAFLSTPFVAIKRRSLAIRILTVLSFFPILASFLFWTVINLPKVTNPEHFFFAKHLMAMPAVYWWGLLALCLALGSAELLLKMAMNSQESVEYVIRQQTADIPYGRYLFLRCSGDEAAAALSAAQFITWLGMKVSAIIGRLISPLYSQRGGLQAIFNFIVTPTILGVTLFGFHTLIPDLASFGFGEFVRFLAATLSQGEILRVVALLLLICVGIVAPFVFVLCLVAALLILVGQALTTRAFGWTDFLTGFMVELAIEPLPFGAHSLTQIDWSADSGGLEGMVHSWTYAHPIAVKHLQEWIGSALQPDIA